MLNTSHTQVLVHSFVQCTTTKQQLQSVSTEYQVG